VQYCEPERPCTYVMGPGNHRRWEISLKDGEDPKAIVEDAATWALLSRWLTPNDGQLWRQAAYRFHALVAEQWRTGRIFIAGDAAHQQPPFLGQGMCQGVRDVVNLCWKLTAVLRGDVAGPAADALLDSYGDERRAHVTDLTTRLKAVGAVICERNVKAARARDRQMLGDAVAGQIVPTPRQDVLPQLRVGLLAQSITAARGSLCPQPWLLKDGARVHMDTLLGTGWRLLVTANADLGEPTPQHVATLGLRVLKFGDGPGRVAEAEGVMAHWFEARRCRAALVRPDNYVFGTVTNAAGLQALLDEATLRLSGAAT
jgi:3-(3-hydroxy-phenyl)propionate hydroxylase